MCQCQDKADPMLDIGIQFPNNSVIEMSFRCSLNLLTLWATRAGLTYEIEQWIGKYTLPTDKPIIIRAFTRCNGCNELLGIKFGTLIEMDKFLESSGIMGDENIVPYEISESITRIFLGLLIEKYLGADFVEKLMWVIVQPNPRGAISRDVEILN